MRARLIFLDWRRSPLRASLICISNLSFLRSVVHSPKLTVNTDGKHQTGVSFTLGETIHFGSLEFITDRLAA
jgi:hypothetical protein